MDTTINFQSLTVKTNSSGINPREPSSRTLLLPYTSLNAPSINENSDGVYSALAM
jgi:hypothetical protein